MSGLTVHALGSAMVRLNAAMPAIEQQLNAADAVLGDGDTGSMLARVIAALASLDLSSAPDVGAAFSAQARTASSATGSSLGTLLMTALMSASKTAKGQKIVTWSALGSLLSSARDAMIARGGAKLGDKTVLDALDAVALAIADVTDPAEIGSRAQAAAIAALTTFRPRQCKIGRARMFGERSQGLDDPGMLSLTLLVEALRT